MTLYIANPIYDSVFKYLMEDERIARTILSALLKKDVVKVEQRPHEYTNAVRSGLSMFRIDFGATIRESDGREHLVLIELQKTWLETETLRFRQYLGVQYSKKENIVEESDDRHALPMVAVYLLGHRVGRITAPVFYVSHKSYDYEGNELKEGFPDPFVDSLTHDSIIVQIPLLHGRVNNRLDKVLSFVDPRNTLQGNRQQIALSEELYADDTDMEYILRRLLSAASDPEVRQDMNVEDEFFKAIEDRDTALLVREQQLQKKDQQLQQKNEQLQQKEEQLQRQDQQLQQKNEQLQQQDQQLQQKNEQLQQQDQQLQQQDQQLQQKNELLLAQTSIIQSLARMLKQSGLDEVEIAEKTGLTLEVIRQL